MSRRTGTVRRRSDCRLNALVDENHRSGYNAVNSLAMVQLIFTFMGEICRNIHSYFLISSGIVSGGILFSGRAGGYSRCFCMDIRPSSRV